MSNIKNLNVNGTAYGIDAINADFAGKLGTSSSSYTYSTLTTALGNKASTSHTHTCSIATDGSTANISLVADSAYKLTAGGGSYIFKTPDSAESFDLPLSAKCSSYITSSSLSLCGVVWKGLIYFRTGSSEYYFTPINYGKLINKGGILILEGLENSEYGELGAIQYYHSYICTSYFTSTTNVDVIRTAFNLEGSAWNLYKGYGPYYSSSSATNSKNTSSSITVRYNNGSTTTSTCTGKGLGWVSGQHGYWSSQVLQLTIPLPPYTAVSGNETNYPIAIYCKNMSTDSGIKFTLLRLK